MAELYQVQCDVYRSHPTSYGQCLALVHVLEEDQRLGKEGVCPLEHEIVPYESLAHLLLTPPPVEHDIGSDSTHAAS